MDVEKIKSSVEEEFIERDLKLKKAAQLIVDSAVALAKSEAAEAEPKAEAAEEAPEKKPAAKKTGTKKAAAKKAEQPAEE